MADAGRRTVLVVDDNEDLCALVQCALEMAGFNVIAAGTGTEALTVFQRALPEIDAAVVDVGLPGISGDQVIARMAEASPRLPILAMSGGDTSRARLALEAGAMCFLAKPFDLLGLAERIGDAIAQQPAGVLQR